jgi:hypothetical protein
LHPLYLRPNQVSGLALDLDRLSLARVVHLQQVLYLPYVRQGLRQPLRRALLLTLLLLALLLLALLLSALLLSALLLSALLLSTLLLLVALGHGDLPFSDSFLALMAGFLPIVGEK